eukprot:scaffold15641_cov39-Attheya_sp.AAC.2
MVPVLPILDPFRMCFMRVKIIAIPWTASRSYAPIPPNSFGPKRIFRGKLLWYPSLDSSRGNSNLCNFQTARSPLLLRLV